MQDVGVENIYDAIYDQQYSVKRPEEILSGIVLVKNGSKENKPVSENEMKNIKRIPSLYFKILFIILSFETGKFIPLNMITERLGAEDLAFIKDGESTDKTIISIIYYWRENGAIDFEDAEDTKIANKFNGTQSAQQNSLEIEIDVVCDMLETKKEFRDFIKNGQRILGKMFNTYDLKILYNLIECYKIDTKLLIELMRYEKSINNTNVAYIEKIAVNLCDSGIFTYEQYEKKLNDMTKSLQIEQDIRELFQLGEKKFTSKERGIINKWWFDYNYGIDIIKKAYDICMEKIGKYQFNYIAGILSNWDKTGLKTLVEIENSNDGNGGGVRVEYQTFDLNQFFEKAVKAGMKYDK